MKRKLIRSFLGVGAMKLAGIPIGLATSIVLARTLDPELFGQYAFVMALVPVIALPVSGGLATLLTREVAVFAHTGKWGLYRGAVRAAHVWVLIGSAVILAVSWFVGTFLGWLPSEGKWSLLPVALLMIPLSALATVRTGIIKGLGLPAYAEMPGQLIQPVVLFCLFAVLAWQGMLDTRSAVWGQVTGAAIIFLVATAIFFRVQPNVVKGRMPEYKVSVWIGALLPFSMIAFVGTFNAQIGMIVLGILGTDEQLAAMRVAERGGQFVIMSLTLVNMVIAPYIVRAHQDGDKEALQSLARRSARGSFFLALPVALILVLFGETLVAIAFGESYAKISYWPIVIICLGQLSNVFFGSVGYLLSMSGYEREALKGQAVSVVVSTVACTVLVPFYGAVGAAAGVSAGILTWNILLCLMVRRHLGINSAAY